MSKRGPGPLSGKATVPVSASRPPPSANTRAVERQHRLVAVVAEIDVGVAEEHFVVADARCRSIVRGDLRRVDRTAHGAGDRARAAESEELVSRPCRRSARSCSATRSSSEKSLLRIVIAQIGDDAFDLQRAGRG